MRVLTLIHLYPPHHLGGYEVACKGAMDRFAERGVEVRVLTNDYRHAGVPDAPSRVPVERRLEGWWDWDSWAPARLGPAARLRREWHNQHTMERVVDEFRPDVASVWDLAFMSWTMATLLEKRGVPIVLTFLDQWVATSSGYDAWTRVFERRPWARPIGSVFGLETRLPSFAGATASVASSMIGETIERDSRWKFPDAELVRLGVDTSDFPISPPRQDRWSWRILFVGRVVPHKGVFTLVRALSLLPEAAHLDIVGHVHEDQRHDLEALAGELGVGERVRFDMAGSRDDLRRRYRQADVVVFPSEWPEPFGIVPLEAMACGTPVVATGTGGSGEFLEDGVNCVRFAPGDHRALAGAVLRLAADETLRRCIAEGGTATAGTLTMDRFADKLHALHLRAFRPGG